MFSQVSVCPQGGKVYMPLPGRHPLPGGHSPLPGRQPLCQADTPTPCQANTPPPPKMATAADGTHPTRIYSCYQWKYRWYGNPESVIDYRVLTSPCTDSVGWLNGEIVIVFDRFRTLGSTKFIKVVLNWIFHYRKKERRRRLCNHFFDHTIWIKMAVIFSNWKCLKIVLTPPLLPQPLSFYNYLFVIKLLTFNLYFRNKICGRTYCRFILYPGGARIVQWQRFGPRSP